MALTTIANGRISRGWLTKSFLYILIALVRPNFSFMICQAIFIVVIMDMQTIKNLDLDLNSRLMQWNIRPATLQERQIWMNMKKKSESGRTNLNDIAESPPFPPPPPPPFLILSATYEKYSPGRKKSPHSWYRGVNITTVQGKKHTAEWPTLFSVCPR